MTKRTVLWCVRCLGRETVRGGVGWLKCVTVREAVEAAEKALTRAFVEGLCRLPTE